MYTYDYNGIGGIIQTLLFAITTNNTPDMALHDPTHFKLYVYFYIVVSLFNYIVMGGIILAVINYTYGNILVEEIEDNDLITGYRRELLE